MNDRIKGAQDQIMPPDGPRRVGSEAGITPRPAEVPAPPPAGAARGHALQWGIAAALLALVVFAAVFAMNYLPFLNIHGTVKPASDPDRDRMLTFLSEAGPRTEDEVQVPSHYDFWFTNDHDKGLLIGLREKACTCSSVEAYLLPEDRRVSMAVASAVGARPGGPLAACVALRFGGFGALSDQQPTELLIRGATFEVPAGSSGWLRLRWKGAHPGGQVLTAKLWMNDRDSGPPLTLGIPVFHHEPLRVRPSLQVGSLSDADLEKGVTRSFYVWSSTRPSFRLEAKPSFVLGGLPQSDPFEVAAPEAMTADELLELDRRNNPADPREGDPSLRGPVLSGYKVRVTFRAFSRDGKVPFDVGAFRRTVVLSSPDLDGAPLLVAVRGRVVGLVELAGNDESKPETIDFLSFPRRQGAEASPLLLTSTVEKLKLEFDDKRTPAFLTARLEGPTLVGKVRQAWKLHASVLPNKASGSFPRVADPLYEDSAIYLRAIVPDKPPRPIRIAVRGTANES